MRLIIARLLYPIFLAIVVAPRFSMSAGHEYHHTIHPLKLLSGLGDDHPVHGVNCISWRLAVETNNFHDWKTIPKECKDYIGHYMLGGQYKRDCSMVTNAAIDYVNSLNITKGNYIWIFDIDDTCLSNVPYYAKPSVGFGAFLFNETGFSEWQAQAMAPPIRAVRKLYKRLLELEVQVVFLSGTREHFRQPKTRNMKNAGYHKWLKMILRQSSESGTKAVEYKTKKREELEKKGYKIIGNIGDQWSDLLGSHPGFRTFKLPNPMYYII